MIRWNGQNEATGLRASGNLQRAQGANAQRQGWMSAGSAILLGGAKFADGLGPTRSIPAGGVSRSAYMAGYSGAG
jgi:hypothetical protein